MKSLEELIEEIRREVTGEREMAGPFEEEVEFEPEAPAPEAPEREAPEPEVADPAAPEPAPPAPPTQAGAFEPAEPEAAESGFDVNVDFDLGLEREDLALSSASRLVDTLAPPPLRPAPEDPPRDGPTRWRDVPLPRSGRRLRRVVLVAITVALGVGAAVWFGLYRDVEAPVVPSPPQPQPLLEQDVVAWAIWQDKAPEIAYVTVLGVGGEQDPFALGIPGYTVVNIPGYGLATVGDAVALQDPERVAAAIENLLGVRVDGAVGSGVRDVGRLVDALGGIGVRTQTLTGETTVAYLTKGKDDPGSAEIRFLQWQDVVAGILAALDEPTQALAEFPPELADALETAGSTGAEVLELPVEDIGSGLARPVAEEVSALISERFVPTAATGREVRLVVLNGEGTPGIGERVARVLVPKGFRLVSSLNATTFNVRGTQIIASSEEFLPEARLARDLLGVGEVFLGEQPTGVSDVTVIIGADFGGP